MADAANIPGILLAVILALIGAIPGILALWQNRRKTNAEATDIAVDTMKEIIAPLKAELAELHIKVDKLEDENAKLKLRVIHLENENGDLKDWADRLVHQVRSLNGTPVKMRGAAHE